MAASDAKDLPVKNLAYRVTFPILDADGDLVTGAAGLDSEVSKDGGTFADCTNEATEIATSSGMYFLDLTADEMNADTVAIIVKTSTSGAKTTPIVLYPAARRINDLAFPTTSGRSIGVETDGHVHADVKEWLGVAPLALSSQRVQGVVPDTQKVDVETIKTQAVTLSGGVTIPAATLASTTNITAATGITVATNNDKTGYGLSSAAVQAIWDALTSALTTAGSIGKLLADNIDATIGSRLASADITLSGGKVTVGTNDDKTGYSLANNAITSSVIAANAITSTGIAANAIGNTQLASGAIGSAQIANNAITSSAIQANALNGKGDWNIGKTGYSLSQAGLAMFFTQDTGETYAGSVGGSVVKEIADNAGGASLTVQQIVDGVWNEPRASHTTAGSFGQGAASVQGNVTGSTASVVGNVGGDVLGNVAGDVEGNVLGNVVGSVASVTAPVTVGTNNDKTAYTVAVGGIGATSFAANAIDAAALATDAANEIADATLKRDWTAITGEAARSMLNALRFLRNKWSINSDVLTVTKENDTTTAWTGAATRTAGDPISEIDPS